eukprot:322045-Prymnesium_polylepis.3
MIALDTCRASSLSSTRKANANENVLTLIAVAVWNLEHEPGFAMKVESEISVSIQTCASPRSSMRLQNSIASSSMLVLLVQSPGGVVKRCTSGSTAAVMSARVEHASTHFASSSICGPSSLVVGAVKNAAKLAVYVLWTTITTVSRPRRSNRPGGPAHA